MGKYFIKGYNWLFEQGLDGIELYDVKGDGKPIFLSYEKSKIFFELLHGTSIHEIDDKEVLQQVLDIIEKNNIGEFTDKYYVNDEYKIGKEEFGYFEQQSSLVKAYIEIPSECNLCNNCDKVFSSRCFSCHKTRLGSNVSIEEYEKIIKGLKENNCQVLLFHGANILTEELTYKLIEISFKYNMSVCLIAHYNMITQEFVTRFNCYKENSENVLEVLLNFDVDDENNTVIDALDEIENKYKLSEESIKISLRIDKNFGKKVLTLKSEIENKGYNIYNVSVVSDNYIGEEELEAIYLIEKYNYDFTKAMKKYHNCLTGTLSFDTELNVMVCPHMRNNIIKTKDGMLDDTSTLRTLWAMNKQKIHKCSTCSRKNRCLECREVEVHFSNELYGKRECEYYNRTAK